VASRISAALAMLELRQQKDFESSDHVLGQASFDKLRTNGY
jgi:hypothetical protein